MDVQATLGSAAHFLEPGDRHGGTVGGQNGAGGRFLAQFLKNRSFQFSVFRNSLDDKIRVLHCFTEIRHLFDRLGTRRPLGPRDDRFHFLRLQVGADFLVGLLKCSFPGIKDLDLVSFMSGDHGDLRAQDPCADNGDLFQGQSFAHTPIS